MKESIQKHPERKILHAFGVLYQSLSMVQGTIMQLVSLALGKAMFPTHFNAANVVAVRIRL